MSLKVLLYLTTRMRRSQLVYSLGGHSGNQITGPELRIPAFNECGCITTLALPLQTCLIGISRQVALDDQAYKDIALGGAKLIARSGRQISGIRRVSTNMRPMTFLSAMPPTATISHAR
jgi:hypothetical protein